MTSIQSKSRTAALLFGVASFVVAIPAQAEWGGGYGERQRGQHRRLGRRRQPELRPWRNQLQGGRLRRWQQAERQQQAGRLEPRPRPRPPRLWRWERQSPDRRLEPGRRLRWQHQRRLEPRPRRLWRRWQTLPER